VETNSCLKGLQFHIPLLVTYSLSSSPWFRYEIKTGEERDLVILKDNVDKLTYQQLYVSH